MCMHWIGFGYDEVSSGYVAIYTLYKTLHNNKDLIDWRRPIDWLRPAKNNGDISKEY